MTTIRKVRLVYFDQRAHAECIRFLLAYGKIDYEDIRVDNEAWLTMKEKTQFAKLPILYIDGDEFDKPIAICRYLGNQMGIDGATPMENFNIDRVVDHVNDLRVVVSEFNLEKACAPRKEELKTELINELLPFYLTRFNTVAVSGFVANGKLSWADFFLVTFLDYTSDVMQQQLLDEYQHLQTLCNKIHRLPGIKEWMAKRPYSVY